MSMPRGLPAPTRGNDDWPTTVSKFERLFERRLTSRKPEGLSGRNFMTPDVLGYVVDGAGNTVEVSTGTGIYDERIFGLTWGTAHSDLNRMVYSLEAARDVIAAAGRD